MCGVPPLIALRLRPGISFPVFSFRADMHFSFVRTKEGFITFSFGQTCTFLLYGQKKRCQKKSRRLNLSGYSLLAPAKRHANSLPAASSDRCRSSRPRCVVRFTPLRLGRGIGLPAGTDKAEKVARHGTSLSPAARQGLPTLASGA